METAPGTHWVGGWMGCRDDLGTVEKEEISFPSQESDLDSPSAQSIACLVYWLSCPSFPFDWTCVLSTSQINTKSAFICFSYQVILLICIYFSESSEDESTELPRKRSCPTFTLDGTGMLWLPSLIKRTIQMSNRIFVSVRLMRHILLIYIYFSESSADESSKPARKRLHSTFTLDGTGAQFNQKNSTNMKSVFVWFG
jgi:hypothetical protein